jgi:hypothetical protein
LKNTTIWEDNMFNRQQKNLKSQKLSMEFKAMLDKQIIMWFVITYMKMVLN